MLRHGADPNTALPRNGRTPLHACAEAGFPDGVEALLRVRGVEVDPKDKKGRQTPLYLAAKSGNLSAVRMLVEANADLDHQCFGKTVSETVKDKFPGFDPATVPKKVARLQKANSVVADLFGLIDSAELATDAGERKAIYDQFRGLLVGADALDQPSSSGGPNLLQRVCSADLTEFCQCLLEEGEMNPNVENLHAPPLLSAARNSNVEMTLSLLKNGASVRTSIDRDTRQTILHVALHQVVFIHLSKTPK